MHDGKETNMGKQMQKVARRLPVGISTWWVWWVRRARSSSPRCRQETHCCRYCRDCWSCSDRVRLQIESIVCRFVSVFAVGQFVDGKTEWLARREARRRRELVVSCFRRVEHKIGHSASRLWFDSEQSLIALVHRSQSPLASWYTQCTKPREQATMSIRSSIAAFLFNRFSSQHMGWT